MAGIVTGSVVLLFCCFAATIFGFSGRISSTEFGVLFRRGLTRLAFNRSRRLLCGTVTCAVCLWGKMFDFGRVHERQRVTTVVNVVLAVSTWKLLPLGVRAVGDGQRLFAERGTHGRVNVTGPARIRRVPPLAFNRGRHATAGYCVFLAEACWWSAYRASCHRCIRHNPTVVIRLALGWVID